MASEWSLHSFSEAPVEIIDGDRGFNYPKKSDFTESGYCLFLSTKNVTASGFDFAQRQFISLEKDTHLRKGRLERYDIIMTTRGTVGNVAYYDERVPYEVLRINSGMVIFRTQMNELTPRFLYYFLKSSVFNEQLLSLLTGSAQPQLPIRDIRRIQIPIPPLEEQNAIVYILGTLDDKIELNRKMNQTLEGIARALFKSWFVDLDPVRAKAAVREKHPEWSNERVSREACLRQAKRGRQACPNLKPEIAELFPDSFVDSELGKIPKGWGVGSIEQCCAKIQNGGTPKRNQSDYWQPGTIPWLTSGEVRQTLIMETSNMISELGFERSSAKWMPRDSTVVALYGATAGQVALIASDMTTNQAVCGLIPKPGFRYLNYLSLDSSVGLLANLARGSAQQNISKSIVATVRIVLPNEHIVDVFDQMVAPVFDKWAANLRESKSLASLRDTLIPELISGELRIPDVGKVLERAL